jgi:hypothetical protein
MAEKGAFLSFEPMPATFCVRFSDQPSALTFRQARAVRRPVIE